jgi:hypothetical protein
VRSKGFRMQVTWIKTLAVVAVVLGYSIVLAAPKADLWPRWEKHDPGDGQKIDHSLWDQFLRKYLVASHASGVNRVRYGAVTLEDRKLLKTYLQTMQSLPISTYNRTEQKAYWINLYNALTVQLVLSRYPVESIREINISPGWFSRGPWGAKLATVEEEKLSLDDIEHRILRPVWKDNRVHYAVNCASLGCPNLQAVAYTGENIEALLDRGAREYVNHSRGVSLANGKLWASSIYIWFQEDFGGSAEGLMEHWLRYANPTLAEALRSYSGGLDHGYDWRLNSPESTLAP